MRGVRDGGPYAIRAGHIITGAHVNPDCRPHLHSNPTILQCCNGAADQICISCLQCASLVDQISNVESLGALHKPCHFCASSFRQHELLHRIFFGCAGQNPASSKRTAELVVEALSFGVRLTP